jgi:hypothetical protein
VNEQEVELYTRHKEHELLPEQMRLENALAIWVRDMRTQELAKVKRGGRLSVAALAYEEVLRLRGGVQRVFAERRRKITARWNRRKARRAARAAASLAMIEHWGEAASAAEKQPAFGTVAWRLQQNK